MLTLTFDQVSAMIPTNTQAAGWVEVLNDNLPQYSIDTPERVACFIAQTAHESQDYNKLHENLNYKAESLIATFPSHFDASNAAQYAHNPQMIANRVYASRNGNRDEASGDGWNYRGRGILQITGKANYAQCSQTMFGDDRLIQQPDLLETDMDAACKSACWFWNMRNLNKYIDAGDFASVTQRINGGQIGAEDREARYQTNLSILQATTQGDDTNVPTS